MDGNSTERSRLDAFEIWIWRRMEKISWTDNVTNKDVLGTVIEDRQIQIDWLH